MVIALISLGCPKNQVDADVMCHALLERGHITTADLSEADAIIVNTCGFIESAKQEAIDSILEACSYKEQKPELKVVVTGCLAQRYQHEIVKEIPEVDAVVGLGSNAAICSILERLTGTQPVESYGAKESLPLGGKRVISTPRHYAYLKSLRAATTAAITAPSRSSAARCAAVPSRILWPKRAFWRVKA